MKMATFQKQNSDCRYTRTTRPFPFKKCQRKLQQVSFPALSTLLLITTLQTLASLAIECRLQGCIDVSRAKRWDTPLGLLGNLFHIHFLPDFLSRLIFKHITRVCLLEFSKNQYYTYHLKNIFGNEPNYFLYLDRFVYFPIFEKCRIYQTNFYLD